MSRIVILASSFVAIYAISAIPARAASPADAWAQCLWQQVPTSANNWLNMPEPNSNQDDEASARFFHLKFRLLSACTKLVMEPGKSVPPSFKHKAVRDALAKSKPANLAQDKIDPYLYVCQYSNGGFSMSSGKPLTSSNDKKCQHVESDGSLTDA